MISALRPLPRAALWLSFFALILWAWWVMYLMTTGMAALPAMDSSGMADMAPMAMTAPGLGALFVMWAIMMAAMMGPTFVPTLRTYEDLIASADGTRAGALGLIFGYFGAWVGAAFVLALAQVLLMASGLAGTMGQSLSTPLSVGLLLAAGLYQFTSLKDRCLAHCRSPMVQFLAHWHPGALGGARMGVHHGLWCVACCWGMMAIGFVGGTMDLRWMGGATVLMTLEKLPDIGRWVTWPIGVGLIIWAGYLVVA